MNETEKAERPTLTRIPVAWCHEDGETWWAEGHWSDEAMLLAVVMEQLAQAGMPSDDLLWLLVGTDKPYTEIGSEWHVAARFERALDDVRRLWMKPEPDDDERWDVCDEFDPQAVPYTSFTR
jgi:hypothetical protein